MRRLSAYLGILSLLASVIMFVGPASAGASQTCNGSGNGNVNGTPKVGQAKGDFDGNGIADRVKLHFDQLGTGDAYTKVILDNGYKAVFHHGQSLAASGILKVRDADQDGDDEIFILNSLGASANQADILFFVDCELQQPVDGEGSPVAPRIGGDGGGAEQNGLDCFAPSAGGKGITTWHGVFSNMTFETTVERLEYRVNDHDNEGPAELILNHQDEIILGDGNPNLEYVNWFNCGPPPECDGKKATIQGTPFRDTMNGTPGKDVIVGLASKDIIDGKRGADRICGNGGNDVIEGKKGGDRMFGHRGKDKLRGGGGNDFAHGGKGNDTCTAEIKKSC